MSVSKEVKKYGFHTVREFLLLSGMNEKTLYNWYEKKPEFLELVLLGARAKQRQNMEKID